MLPLCPPPYCDSPVHINDLQAIRRVCCTFQSLTLKCEKGKVLPSEETFLHQVQPHNLKDCFTFSCFQFLLKISKFRLAYLLARDTPGYEVSPEF